MKTPSTRVPFRAMRRPAALMLLLASAFLSSAKAETHLSDRGEAELHTMLNVARLSALTSERLTSFAEQADRLYAPAYHSLLWVEHRRPTPQANAVLDQLLHAEDKGLLASDYNGCLGEFCHGLTKISRGSSETEAICFDLAVTLATIQYLSDLHLGRANPATNASRTCANTWTRCKKDKTTLRSSP